MENLGERFFLLTIVLLMRALALTLPALFGHAQSIIDSGSSS